MSKITEAFTNKKAFIGFLTAGDPSLEKTEEFIVEMARAGAALIEIGIPFSDPIAEGPVIQSANVRALSAPGGCTTDMVFDMVARVSRKVDVPLVFLTYLNPVFKYGYEAFCKKCNEVGISGIIIPDMPFEERGELEPIAEKYDVDIISLIAPTSRERIRMIAGRAKGYIYLVSSMGVTGVRNEITTDVGGIIEEIRAVTDTPVAVGFGINTPEQAARYAAMADGVIVGSAIVKIIEQYGEDAGKYIYEYVKGMVEAKTD
ncbi:MAG: tryptophan synthase subunit alpha [Lachnospiraceae bacterium]|nr:tryptophan synthase subunit alpha [Lachnospiraceae bacterium]